MANEIPPDVILFTAQDGAQCALVPVHSENLKVRVKWALMLHSGLRRALALSARPPWLIKAGTAANLICNCSKASGRNLALGRVLIDAAGSEKVELIDRSIRDGFMIGDREFSGVINYRDENLRIKSGYSIRRDIDALKIARGRP